MAGDIKQYTSPVNRLVPSQEGAAAHEQAARRIESQGNAAARDLSSSAMLLGRSVGSAVNDVQEAVEKHLTQSEISQGAADLAGFHQSLLDDWEKTAKDPANSSNPNLAAQFNQGVEARYEEFASKFHTPGGQKWADAQVASLRQHMYEKTWGDQGTMAHDALVTNLDVLKNRSSNLARQDPHSTDEAMGLVDNSVQALVENAHGLTAPDAAKVRGQYTQAIKEQIAKSAVIGMAEKNPDAAQALIDSGKYADYIDGQQMGQFVKGIRAAKLQDERLARIEENQKKADASEKATNDYLGSMTDPDTGRLRATPNILTQMMADPSLKPSAKLELYRIGAKGEDVETGRGVLRTVLDGISKGTETQETILSRVARDDGTGLSKADADFALARLKPTPENRFDLDLINGSVKNAHAQATKGMINFGTGAVSPEGQAAEYAFDQWFYPALQNGLRTKTATQLLTPGPDYLLTPENMALHAKPTGNSLMDAINPANQGLGPPPPPTTPGAVAAPEDEGFRKAKLKAILDGGQ